MRIDIANALEAAGMKSSDYVKESFTPPVAIVTPGDPYLYDDGDTPFGHKTVNLQILLIGPRATNSVVSNAMDDLISRAIVALGDWDVSEVSQPQQVVVKNINHIGSVLTVSEIIKIEEE